MTKTNRSRVAGLNRSIALQERTIALLSANTYADGGATIALAHQIIATLRAQIALVEAAS